MRTVEIDPDLPFPGQDASPLDLAQYIVARLSRRASGALYGKWDQARREGVWFFSDDALCIFDAPPVDEVVFRDGDRARFRSVVFRLGTLGSFCEGGLCGAMELMPRGAGGTPLPKRRYFTHASFEPKAGLWFKAAIVHDGHGVHEAAADDSTSAGPPSPGVRRR